ncbi:MAG: hypothetical protein ACREIQ_11960, partial [Nitrospiria bacterium]
MKIEGRKFLGIMLAFALVLATNSLAISGEGHDHAMPGQLSVGEQQFYLEQQKATSANAPAGVQYQPAGVALLQNLEQRLDQEIEKAGGNLGGYYSGAQAHAMMQGTP